MKRSILFTGRSREVRENIKLPIFYLLLAGSFADWQTLYNVHLDSIGYTSIQIGLLNALFISTSAIVVPFWGMLAEEFGNNRVLLLLSTVAGLLVFFIGQTMTFHWMLIFIFMISTMRMVLYGFIAVPEIAVYLSFFHGVTIAFFLIGVVDYVQRQTPDHLCTTGQALIWAFHFGAGVTFGNFMLGYLRDHGGMLKAMHIFAVIAMAMVAGTGWFFQRFRDVAVDK